MTTVLGLARVGPDPLTDGLIESIECAAAESGLITRRVMSAQEERSVDTLLVVGYPRTYAAFLDAPRSARRIAWFGEPLPRFPAGPTVRGLRSQTAARAALLALRRPLGRVTRRAMPAVLGWVREAATIAHEREANLTDAIWCSRSVDLVVVTSRDRARTLAEHSIDAAVVPFGYHSAGAGPLVAPGREGRDISVAVLGSGVGARHGRRGRLIATIAPALETIGTVVRLEGVWGAERDTILGRTRIVLDIQRVPGNFTGLRFLTTIAAGALLVTEPLDDPYPFVPGVDHVEVPTTGIVRAVAAVLADEPRRRALVEAGQARLTGELSMRTALERVLAA